MTAIFSLKSSPEPLCRFLVGIQHLLIAGGSGLAGLHQVLGVVAHQDAAVVLDLAAALILGDHGHAALAGGQSKAIFVFIQPVGDVLNVQGLALVGDGLFHRDHMEAQPRAAGRHHVGDGGQRQVGHLIGELTHLRVRGLQLLVEHQVLRAAYHEYRHHILLVVILIMPVVFHNAGLGQLVQQTLHFGFVPFQLFCQLRRGVGLAHLHFQHQLGHLVGENGVQHPVFRAALVHFSLPQLDIHAVGDMLCQFYDDLSHCALLSHAIVKL